MSADSDAAQTVSLLPGLTPAEQQYLVTVARGEGFYGLGWGNPSPKTIADSATLNIDPKAGVGSNNWGAVQGAGNAGSFPHVDYHADGSMYLGTFRKYVAPQDGAADVAKILLKPNVKAAVNAGDLHGAVMAQHANHYFELNPEAYFRAVKKNYDILTASLKWPTLLQVTQAAETIAANPLVSGLPSSSLEGSYSGVPSLKLGSQGSAVREWQSIVGVAVDGLFGYGTEVATRAWQKQFHLVPDGIVGTLSWSKAHGA